MINQNISSKAPQSLFRVLVCDGIFRAFGADTGFECCRGASEKNLCGNAHRLVCLFRPAAENRRQRSVFNAFRLQHALAYVAVFGRDVLPSALSSEKTRPFVRRGVPCRIRASFRVSALAEAFDRE